MRVFHYTALHHARDIIVSGAISKGAIPVPDAAGEYLVGHVPGWQWVTTDADWRQSWATRLHHTCDRTEVRLVVEIPLLELHRLKQWDKVAADYGYTPAIAKAFAEINGGTDSSPWFVFQGPIPTRWIVDQERRPSDVISGGTKRARRRARCGVPA